MLLLAAFILISYIPASLDLFQMTDLPDKLVNGLTSNSGEPLIPLRYRVLLWGLGLFTLVYSLLEVLFSASLGKFILGLRIRTLTGAPASYRTLFWRYLLKNGTQVIGFLSVIVDSTGLAMISELWGIVFSAGCLLALGKERMALHDILAGTAVYRVGYIPPAKASGSSPPPAPPFITEPPDQFTGS